MATEYRIRYWKNDSGDNFRNAKSLIEAYARAAYFLQSGDAVAFEIESRTVTEWETVKGDEHER